MNREISPSNVYSAMSALMSAADSPIEAPVYCSDVIPPIARSLSTMRGLKPPLT